MTDTTTAAVTTNATAFVTKGTDGKFTCTFNGANLGTSKHADYFEYHLRRKDVKVLNDAGIQFITYLDEQGAAIKTVDVTVKLVRAKKAAPAVTAPAADTTASAPAADAGIPLADTSVPVATDAPAAAAVPADTQAAV